MTMNSLFKGNRVLGPQLDSFLHAGWDVHLLVDLGDVSRDELPAWLHLHEVTLPRRISPWSDLSALFKWARQLRQIRPDVVLASSPKGGLLGAYAGLLAGVPVRVYWIRGTKWSPELSKGFSVLRLFDSITLLGSTHAVAVSPTLARIFRDSVPFGGKVIALGRGGSRGVDLRLFPPQADPSEGASPVVVTMVGRLSSGKGLDAIPAIASHLAEDSIEDVVVRIAGEVDPDDPIPERLLAELEELKNVELVGWSHDVPGLLRQSDVFLFLSEREGLPNSVLEAGAAGLPTVAWAIPGTVDVIEHGQNGLLAPLGDVGQLVEYLSELLKDRELRVSMGRAARRNVEDHFDSREVQAAFIRYVEGIATIGLQG